jgi:hypothetical protein
MLALVDPKSGFRRQISDKKSENSVYFTPGFRLGETSPPNQPALAEKPGVA